MPLDATPFLKNDQGRCSSERWNSAGAHGNGDDHEGDDHNSTNNDNGHHGDSKPHGHANGDDR
jgi:hypothetical protein